MPRWSARRVLELRIHGVDNAAPHTTLDLGARDVERVAGDELGSFWRPTRRALLRTGPDHPGHVPPGVIREVYSWGGLSRTTPLAGTGAPTPAQALVGGFVRLGWALMLPFGLLNVAFWSRRLEPGGQASGWQDGVGAAATRLFALLLTLLLVSTVGVVALDLLATQCFAGGQLACERVPGGLEALASATHGQRLAVAGLVPVAVLGLVALLSMVSRTRYEQLVTVPSGGGARSQPPLATHGFWSSACLTAATARLHLAGGLFLVVLSTAWHQVVVAVHGCTAGAVLVCGVGVLSSPSAVPFGLTAALALAGLLVVGVVVASRASCHLARPGGAGARGVERRASVVLAFGSLLIVAQTVLLVVVPHDVGDTALQGSAGVPVVLTVAMLGIAVPALRWRGRAGRRHEAWGGRAPGVVLILALGSALALSSLVVVAAGDWLNGRRPAGDLARQGDSLLVVPPVLLWFGVAALVALVGVGAVVGVAAARTARTLEPAGSLVDAGAGPAAGRKGARGTASSRFLGRAGAGAALGRARRSAALAHRAEPLLGVLALAVGLSVVVALALAATVGQGGDGRPLAGVADRAVAGASLPGQVVGVLVDVALWSVGAVAALVAVSLVGGVMIARNRPLGVVWDIVCVLPRAGHPFGPPCYAERAVPELVHRYDAALREGSGSGRVVVSAHSMGAVLAVASVIAARVELGAAAVRRLALLTYGTQLGPWAGRLLPELVGPAATGAAPVRGARLFAPDPWTDLDVARGRPRAVTASDDRTWTLVGLLSGRAGLRWVNLWRRTDPLGLPVEPRCTDAPGVRGVDRAAEEVETSGYLPVVAGHGGYPRTAAYRTAMEDLLRTF
ncbi:hypothetical protein [Actinotalea sp. K2]|uniref:hypothetical protein n=1 Tax=Actinotalea sp. K2 TaxID=2939438 RepID=UPI0020177022|nr:hypothetical protein [Actinotalea sp. K2]